MPVFPAGNNQLKFTKKNLLNGLKILARHKLIMAKRDAVAKRAKRDAGKKVKCYSET